MDTIRWVSRSTVIVIPVLAFIAAYLVCSIASGLLGSCGKADDEVITMGLPVDAQYVAMQAGTGERPPGQWADGLCSCFNDCTLCLTTTILPCIPLAQLYERMMGARNVSKPPFRIARWHPLLTATGHTYWSHFLVLLEAIAFP